MRAIVLRIGLGAVLVTGGFLAALQPGAPNAMAQETGTTQTDSTTQSGPTTTVPPPSSTSTTTTTTTTTVPDCRVKVFITSIKLVRATDADLNDTLAWDTLIVEINGITNAAPPFFMTSSGGERAGFPEGGTFTFTDGDGNPIFGHLLFDEVVGKKGDDLTGRVELGVRETDLQFEHEPGVGLVRNGGATDHGSLEAKLPKKLLFCTVRKFDVVAEVKIKHAKHPGFPKDPEDKHPPKDGLAEVNLHIDIDP